MKYSMATLLSLMALSACGPAPEINSAAIVLPEPEAPTILVTPSPSPTVVASPSPSPSPQAVTVKTYASNQDNLICPAFRSLVPATTTIVVTYMGAGYYYTFAESGVTYTLYSDGSTGTVGSAVLLYGANPSNPNCKVTVQGGQIVSIQ